MIARIEAASGYFPVGARVMVPAAARFRTVRSVTPSKPASSCADTSEVIEEFLTSSSIRKRKLGFQKLENAEEGRWRRARRSMPRKDPRRGWGCRPPSGADTPSNRQGVPPAGARGFPPHWCGAPEAPSGTPPCEFARCVAVGAPQGALYPVPTVRMEGGLDSDRPGRKRAARDRRARPHRAPLSALVTAPPAPAGGRGAAPSIGGWGAGVSSQSSDAAASRASRRTRSASARSA